MLDFACSNNGKAAVHCHAGLGRTGVLIACYIIFAERISANEAIRKVRKPRPPSIQTREQINCVKDFYAYIRPMWVIYGAPTHTFSLFHFLQRQMKILHGEERRKLRYIPKIVFVVCTRLLEIAEVDFDLTASVKVKFSMRKPRALQPSVVVKPSSEITSAVPATDDSGASTPHEATDADDTNLLRLSEEEVFCLKRENTDIPIVKRSIMSDIVTTVPTSLQQEEEEEEGSFSPLDVCKKSSSLPNVSFVSSADEPVSLPDELFIDIISPKVI